MVNLLGDSYGIICAEKNIQRERPFDPDLINQAAIGETKLWNFAITKWFEYYQRDSAAAGFTNLCEPQMTAELTSVLRRAFPRAAAEASPGSGSHRIDIVSHQESYNRLINTCL
uniref:Uncharacterized protein n=1 Tax=Ditylenchus dipsaci TaxID=166011 RepID=A0A915D7C3_9BILA